MAPPAPPAASETPAPGGARDLRDHEAILRRGFEEGRATHGALALPFDDFARHALLRTRRRLAGEGGEPPPEEVGEALSRAALADLFLAAACEAGVPGAWEAFASLARGAVLALALRAGASRVDAEEMAHSFPGDLFAAPPGSGARTRLGSYDGSGSLVGWLGVIVRRRLADRRRGPAAARAASGAGAAGGGEAEARSDPRPCDPAALAADAETARRFGEALRGSWAALTDRERLVLVLRYRDGVAQREIARLLGIGEPRVSRSIQGAVAKIRSVAIRILGPRPGEGAGDAGDPWAALERAVADFMGTLPARSDPPTDG